LPGERKSEDFLQARETRCTALPFLEYPDPFLDPKDTYKTNSYEYHSGRSVPSAKYIVDLGFIRNARSVHQSKQRSRQRNKEKLEPLQNE